MPLPKIIPPDDDGEVKSDFGFGPGFSKGVAATYNAALEGVRRAVGAKPPTDPPRVGEYYADYSAPTPEEIAATDADCADLFARSKPVSR
jgi:hypothetical protein